MSDQPPTSADALKALHQLGWGAGDHATAGPGGFEWHVVAFKAGAVIHASAPAQLAAWRIAVDEAHQHASPGRNGAH